eukprot:8340-Heterococcus_DN1.PRE.1
MQLLMQDEALRVSLESDDQLPAQEEQAQQDRVAKAQKQREDARYISLHTASVTTCIILADALLFDTPIGVRQLAPSACFHA